MGMLKIFKVSLCLWALCWDYVKKTKSLVYASFVFGFTKNKSVVCVQCAGDFFKKGGSKVCEFCVGYFEKSIESMVCGKDYFLLKSQDNRIKKSLTFSDNFQKSQFNYVNRLSAVILFDFRSKNQTVNTTTLFEVRKFEVGSKVQSNVGM